MDKKVLLADNSKVCLEIEQELLRKLPVKIFTAANGPQLLDLARKFHPDLILMDMELPVKDGPACCAAIKEDTALEGTRVVLMSPQIEQKESACRVAGCDAIIKKPIDRRDFISVTRAMLALDDRLEDRIPCRATVTCRRQDAVFCGTIEDIAPRGMFVGSRFDVKIGEIMSLKFFLPVSGAGIIESDARVIWINGGRVRRNPQLPQGFGVVFENLGAEDAGHIGEFIERSILWDKLPSEW